MIMRELTAVAGWVWENSLAASVLIGLVLTFRIALRRSAPPQLMYWLGLLIMARLLLPSAPQSPASVFNLVESSVHGPTDIVAPTVLISTKPVPSQADFNFYDYLPALWILGAALLFGRALQQHGRVWRWVKEGKPVTDERVLGVLSDACREHRIKRPPGLRIVSKIGVPALFGFFRPVILLPEEMNKRDDLHLIFLHELAHIRRRHVLVNWIAIIARALHWFNPLVWLALRRLRADQEILCDLDVTRIIGAEQTRSYGETLLALASSAARPLPTVLPISTNFKQLKERIHMITQFKPVTKRLLVLGFLLAATLSVVTFTKAVDSKPSKSRPVVEKKENQGAAEERARNRLNIMSDELARLTAQIEEMQEQMYKIRVTEGLAITASGDGLREDGRIQDLEKELLQAQRDSSTIRSLYDALRKKKREEVRQAIPTTYPDEHLNQRLAELSKAEQQLASLSKDYSDDHPEMVRVKELLKKINRQIEDRTDGILNGLQNSVEAREKVAEMIAKKLDETRLKESKMQRESHQYFRMKRDLDNMQKVRDGLYVRLLQEKIESRIPKD
jgi:beta-lactamase regulating signal transducer with metallopeptidase domain